MTTAHRKRKRKNEDVGLRRKGETHLADKILAAQARGETRVQIRHMKQKHRRKALRKRKQQTKRTRAIRAAAQKHLRIRAKQNKAVKRIKIMTWNARGWGAAYTTLDPRIKAQCLVNMAEVRGIGLIVFTDLKFPQQGLRTYHTETSKFVLLVTGTIGFLMNAQWHQWWVEGGRQWVMPEPQGNNRIRSAAIVFPRKGWRRGLYVIGVYAPTSSARKSERTDCIKQVQALLDKTPGSFMRIVAGDCNAELGTGTHGDWQDVLGEQGAERRSRWGVDWLEFCRTAGLVAAHSYYTQRCRGTWWHPRYLTEHTLDHIFISKGDQWHLTNCQAVHVGHERDDGVTGNIWHWGKYTDHNPLEAVLRTGKLWVPKATPQEAIPRADIAKLWGVGEAASQHRTNYREALQQKLTDTAPVHPVDWPTLVQTCHETAIEVLGIQQRTEQRPWLQGHMETLRHLDQAVSHAQRRDREARGHPRPWDEATSQQANIARRNLNRARRRRRQQMGDWETTYWSALAQQALKAEQNKDQGELFRIHRLLGAHRSLKRRDGAEVTPTDLEAEREAWKDHFKAIQTGEGQVPDRVWNNVTRTVGVAEWLARKPTIEEVERVIGQLQNRRAAGEDGFMAEFLKYGGSPVCAALHNIVTRAWELATQSGENLEAAEWPQEWKVGLVVPLWKRKGEKTDKNTWRGVTLLSVGTKVMARLITNRLARWANQWIHESQTGFRAGCGTDDVQQVSRRVAEEISRTTSDEVVLIRFFDIEKAYPRVCRSAMWKVLQVRGCPEGAIKVLQALHNHTEMKVR